MTIGLTGNFGKLPRPPAGEDKRQWDMWYEKIYKLLGGYPGIPWDTVDKTGSELSDIETRPHSQLTNIDGTGTHHISTSENAEITALDSLATSGLVTKTANATYVTRTITGTDGQIVIVNGNGLGGNPTASLQTVWNDAFVDALSLRGGSTDPPVFAAFMNTIFGNRFDNAAIMSAHGTIELPHDYKEGTDVDFHVHWSPTTTNTGNIQWSIEYSVAPINGTFPASTTTSAVQAGDGTIAKHQLCDVATIAGSTFKISTVIAFRIFRDGNAVADTFTGNAFLHRVAVHYQADTNGSRQETVK